MTTDYIAIDISKDNLQVRSLRHDGSLSYNQAGLTALANLATTHHNPVVVCEATGGYERTLLCWLFEQHIPVCLVNPARVRAFARSEGLKAKTDHLDAKLLLGFAQSKQLKAMSAPSPKQLELISLMDRRSQLTEAAAREKNRLQNSLPFIRTSIQKMIRHLEKQLEGIEQRIRALLKTEVHLRQQSEIMQSVCGIGETTAWTILAYLREIASVGRNQLVALAGIAPYDRDSGIFKGKRRIEGGRAKVRKCLFMAAQSAAVHNPHIHAYVQSLINRGKPYKAAIVAAMRKLLIHLQSLIKYHKKSLA